MLESLYQMLGFTSPAPIPPVIGISGGNADSASVRAMMTQIASAGATPIFLGNHSKRNPVEDIAKIDALVVMGNNADIDPERYGQSAHAKTNAESKTPEGKARADYEYGLMQLAIQSSMPLLGVCGGMQRLNVMQGGSLHQHVGDITGNDDHAQQDHNIAPFIPVQVVTIAPGTMLSTISSGVSAVYTPTHAKTPLPVIMENSMHHQAVNKVGSGLRVAGFSLEPDRNGNPVTITEAIEADPNGPFKNQFMLGVQWHPEFSASPLGSFIAKRVTQEAQAFAKAHGRTHAMQEAVEENVFSAVPVINIADEPRVAKGGFTAGILAKREASFPSLRA